MKHQLLRISLITILFAGFLIPEDAEARRRNPRRARQSRCYGEQPQPMQNVGPGTQYENLRKSGNPDMRIHSSLLSRLNSMAGSSGLPNPIQIRSGFRGCARNRRVGGASNSNHLRGTAVDIVPSTGQVGMAGIIGRLGLRTFFNSCRPHVHADLSGSGLVGDECKGRRRSRRR